MYVLVYLYDGTPGGTPYPYASFDHPSHHVPGSGTSIANYYWVDVKDHDDLSISYEGLWTSPPINVGSLPSEWGEQEGWSQGSLRMTIIPSQGYREVMSGGGGGGWEFDFGPTTETPAGGGRGREWF